MASTRSKATTRGAGRSAPAHTPKQAFLALVRDGARIQIAACTAATKTLAESAQTADRYTQAVADELLVPIDN